MSEVREKFVKIKRVDDDQRIVYGEVYAPFVLDTYGEFMLPNDIVKMAHDFLTLDLKSVIDTHHDNVPNGSYPVESFVARKNDPDYTDGAWVLGVKVPSDTVWKDIKDGKINGFSFEAMVHAVDMEIEFLVVRDHVGETYETDGHAHVFYVEVNEDGVIIGGYTDEVDGHSHKIVRGSVTMPAAGHTHRLSLR